MAQRQATKRGQPVLVPLTFRGEVLNVADILRRMSRGPTRTKLGASQHVLGIKKQARVGVMFLNLPPALADVEENAVTVFWQNVTQPAISHWLPFLAELFL